LITRAFAVDQRSTLSARRAGGTPDRRSGEVPVEGPHPRGSTGQDGHVGLEPGPIAGSVEVTDSSGTFDFIEGALTGDVRLGHLYVGCFLLAR
jgi:hypothetical protein